jgi:hypothetical protein
MVIDTFDNIYITGYSYIPIASYDYVTVAFDSDGNELWVRRYDGPANSYDAPSDMVVDLSGNVFVTGYCSSFGTRYDYGTVKYSFYQNQPPTANAGSDQTVECQCPSGAQVTLDGSGSSDPDEDDLTYTWTWDGGSATGVNPQVTFPLGTTTVTLVVNDGTVDSIPDTVDITVEDTTPPEINVKKDPIVLWPPNHKYHKIEIDDFVTSVNDICDAEVSINDIIITSVSSDELEDEKGGGDGNTQGDIVIVDSQTVKLRAERQGGGNGRVYTINFEVTDGEGNTAYGSFKVCVPHDEEKTAVDDGASAGYTVNA